MKTDFEEKLLQTESLIQTLESEVQTRDQRINHLEAENGEHERNLKQQGEELRMANEAIINYRELNDELVMKYEKLESQEKSKNEKVNLKQHDDLF